MVKPSTALTRSAIIAAASEEAEHLPAGGISNSVASSGVETAMPAQIRSKEKV